MDLTVAVAVVCLVLAGLSLLPALIALPGRFLFWPVMHAVDEEEDRTGTISVPRPLHRHSPGSRAGSLPSRTSGLRPPFPGAQ